MSPPGRSEPAGQPDRRTQKLALDAEIMRVLWFHLRIEKEKPAPADRKKGLLRESVVSLRDKAIEWDTKTSFRSK